MQKKQKIFLPFLVFIIFSLLIFFLSSNNLLSGFTSGLENMTNPIRQTIYNAFGKSETDTEQLKKLKNENIRLAAELSDKREQDLEIAALRAQFASDYPSPKKLLPASIIGRNDKEFIINKGEKDGVDKESVVVYEDNLVGVIGKETGHLSAVLFLTDENVSFTAKTSKTGAKGVLVGDGGGMVLQNVTLSDKLEKGDLVVTSGNVDSKGGIPPDLVVGKIISINKKSSDVFQSAEVKSLVDIESLETVFVKIADSL